MGDSWWIKFGNKRSIHLLWLDHCVVFFDKITNWHCWNGGIYCAKKKRNNRLKYTHVILKKKPNLSLNKSRITFSLFYKKRYDSCWLFYRFFKVFCFTHLYWKFSQFYFLNVWLSFFFVSLTDSPGQATFDVKITSSSGRVRAWVQKLDRKDGSFIVRYRMFASYPDLTIEITHKGKNVANSPYKLEGKGM